MMYYYIILIISGLANAVLYGLLKYTAKLFTAKSDEVIDLKTKLSEAYRLTLLSDTRNILYQGPNTIDQTSISLVRLAVKNDNVNESKEAALIACKAILNHLNKKG